MENYQTGSSCNRAADVSTRQFLSRRTVFFLLITILLTALPLLTVADETDPVVIVRSKSGNEYTFISKSGHTWACAVRIAERHYSTKGYMIGGSEQPFWLFNIKVDMGDFSKIIALKDVSAVRFPDSKKGSFKIAVEMRDGKIWKMALQGKYLQLDKNDGITGVEKERGEITIPFSKIAEIRILNPSEICTSEAPEDMTPAKLDQ